MNITKMKTKKYRTQEQKLSKQIIEYYFNNPHANSSKYIQDKFKVNEVTVRKVLSKELERRFENSITRRFINKY